MRPKSETKMIKSFILSKVNDGKDKKIPWYHIPQSIKDVWIDVWERMTEKEKELYN